MPWDYGLDGFVKWDAVLRSLQLRSAVDDEAVLLRRVPAYVSIVLVSRESPQALVDTVTALY